jgi:hypothetical protein
MSEKTIDSHFIDWINKNITFGYGSGEPHTIPALRKFLSLCGNDEHPTSYNYRDIEEAITPLGCWLIMDILGKADIIEYGTSPRFGWLTPHGAKLKDYMISKTDDDLVELVCNMGCDDIIYHQDFCNCGENGYSEKKLCFNPFW